MIKQVLEDKSRVEKINNELSNKVMTLMKTFEEDKEKDVQKERKKYEYNQTQMKRELDETRRQKDDNEKKLFQKIIQLEKKLNEREEQMKILGNGIESLKKELQLREDPSHTSVQVVKYLEKFAKYQNEFMHSEMKSMQDDYSKLKTETTKNEEGANQIKGRQLDLLSKYEFVNNELELKKEILNIKEEELDAIKQENNNLMIAMELLRKEKIQISNIRKSNNEMKNQIVHYRGLVRRLAITNSSKAGGAGVSLAGIDPDFTMKQDQTMNDSKNINQAAVNNTTDLVTYGFEQLVKEYEDSLSELLRIETLQKVMKHNKDL